MWRYYQIARFLCTSYAWAQVVLGPSADGGFYLVGSSQPQPNLMQVLTIYRFNCHQAQLAARLHHARAPSKQPVTEVRACAVS